MISLAYVITCAATSSVRNASAAQACSNVLFISRTDEALTSLWVVAPFNANGWGKPVTV